MISLGVWRSWDVTQGYFVMGVLPDLFRVSDETRSFSLSKREYLKVFVTLHDSFVYNWYGKKAYLIVIAS